MQDPNNWARYALNLGVKSAGHPIEYCRILIQIGFEPIAPRATYTIFGKPALALPSVFEYIGHVRRKQGFLGLYRGNTARVCGIYLHNFVFDQIQKYWVFENENEEANLSDEEKVMLFLKKTSRNMLAQCASVIISQPFHVITVRTVAQFIGGEQAYNGVFSSLVEIYRQDGIRGFFAGVVPRLLGEILSLWLAGCLTFVINTYLIKDNDLKLYTEASMMFLASAVTYPFILVSKVMMVNGTSLRCGRPPIMPIYSSWTDCWISLNKENQLKRGSSLLWRYYKEPVLLSPYVAPPRNFQSPHLKKYL